MRELPGLAGFDIMDRWAADVNAADEAELLAGLVERLGGSHIHIDLANEAAARAEARAERSARRVRPLQQADWRPSGRLTESRVREQYAKSWPKTCPAPWPTCCAEEGEGRP